MKDTVLELSRVSKSFQEGKTILRVLEEINAKFFQGNSYAISGVSGSGKSTLMHIMAGIESPDGGTVFFSGKSLSTFSSLERSQLLNKQMGLVFQNPYLIKELTILENTALKGLISGESRDESYQRARVLLKQVGLASKDHTYPGALSGGQQQRAALARALFHRPTVILADEPTGNLDKATGKSIIDLLVEHQKSDGSALVICSHDPYVLDTMEHGYVLSGGLLQKIKG
ncbi:ABC transporter ATP-binding protein [Candidatus Babeliales bacterium]|nr:ABC transporter ATP-binding protein [Candidatus Babeliales bacterium]